MSHFGCEVPQQGLNFCKNLRRCTDRDGERARFRSRPFAATDTLARALENVTARLKTIWGTRDIIARPSIDLRLEILRRHHPELDVRLIEGAGHWVMYEGAEKFNAAFLELQQDAQS